MIWDQWGGAAAVADASLIPDFSMVEDSVTVRIVRGYTTLEAPYEFDPDFRIDALGQRDRGAHQRVLGQLGGHLDAGALEVRGHVLGHEVSLEQLPAVGRLLQPREVPG